MSGNDQVPIVISREEAIIKLKSILKTDSQRSEEKALEEKKKPMDEPRSMRFSQMVNLREYDGELAPDTVRSTKQQPIYRVLNFRTDENDLIVDSSPSDSKTNKPVKKVQLESFKITRHHLNGCIKAKSMSLDQQCYIRITTSRKHPRPRISAVHVGQRSSSNSDQSRGSYYKTKIDFKNRLPKIRRKSVRREEKTNGRATQYEVQSDGEFEGIRWRVSP